MSVMFKADLETNVFEQLKMDFTDKTKEFNVNSMLSLKTVQKF